MAETTIFLNDNYNVSSSTNTVVNYVAATIEEAKSDIIQDIRPEINDIVDEKIASLDINPDRFSLTNHLHSQYALVSETYSKQETDLKIETSIPDLSPYATKDELNNFSTISHQHSDYALAENVYSKLEVDLKIETFTPDLSDYFNKSETLNLISEFKPVQYLTTLQYEELESKDPSTLYILTDSQEEAVDLTAYYTKSETDNLISGFKNIEYLTTEAYNSLENKDENKLYVLTDSQEETVDLSQYVTKDELNAKGYKVITYITTEAYNNLENKDENTLYILTDSQEETVDLSQYVTKDELNAKGFKSIQYITTSDYEALDPKSPDVLYILTDSQEPTIDLSSYSLTNHLHDSYALNSSLSEHVNDASAHFTAADRELYESFVEAFYRAPGNDEWDLVPKGIFEDTMGDISTSMGQFDTRITNNDSSIASIKTRLNEFSLTSHTHDSYALVDDVYFKKEVDGMIPKICTLDIYAIANGVVTVTEEMWNEWIDCLINHGIFYQDNGDVRLTLEVTSGVDANGEETDDITFTIVGDRGYSYMLTISKEEDKEGNISFTVNSPNEYYPVYNIVDINEWDDDKWNCVMRNLGLSIFTLGGILLNISYDDDNLLTISTVDNGSIIVYRVTREASRKPASYTYTVTGEEHPVYNIVDINEWDDDKWNYVMRNLGLSIFTLGGILLNISYDDDNLLTISTVDNGSIIVYRVTREASSRKPASYTYTVTEEEQYEVEEIVDLNTWNDEKWNIVYNNSNGVKLFNYENKPLNVSENKEGQLLLSYLENGTTLRVFTVTQFATRSASGNTYTVETNDFDIADLENFYTKDYIDTSLNDVYTKSQVYTKTEIDAMIGNIETSLASI